MQTHSDHRGTAKEASALIGPPSYGDFDHIFADPIHPTAVSNAILANGIITAVNAKFDDDIPLYGEVELAILAFPELVP